MLARGKVWNPAERCKKVLERLWDDAYGSSFQYPVDTDAYEDYLDIVSEPICLQDVKNKLENGIYKGHTLPFFYPFILYSYNEIEKILDCREEDVFETVDEIAPEVVEAGAHVGEETSQPQTSQKNLSKVKTKVPPPSTTTTSSSSENISVKCLFKILFSNFFSFFKFFFLVVLRYKIIVKKKFKVTLFFKEEKEKRKKRRKFILIILLKEI